MVSKRTPLWLAAVTLWVAAAAHAAPITPTAQTRTLSGTANAADMSGTANDSDGDSAADFGPFDEAASASASLPDALGAGGGEQDSRIQPRSIVATGSAFATAESFALDGSADGSGESRLDVDFTLSVESDYTLEGFIAGFDNGGTDVFLEDTGGVIFSDFASGGQIDLDESGTLPAGDYRLLVVSSGSAFGDFFTSEFAFAEFDVSFRVKPVAQTVPIGGWAAVATGLLLGGSGAGAARGRRPL